MLKKSFIPMLVAVALLLGYPWLVHLILSFSGGAMDLAAHGQYGDQFGMLSAVLNASGVVLALEVFRRQRAGEAEAQKLTSDQVEAAKKSQENLAAQVAATTEGLTRVTSAISDLLKAGENRAARNEAALLEARLASCVTALATSIPEIEKRIPNMIKGSDQAATKAAQEKVRDETVGDFASGVVALRAVQKGIEKQIEEMRAAAGT